MPSRSILLLLSTLLALAGCGLSQVGTIPFTPTADQGGGAAVVQDWLARHPGG